MWGYKQVCLELDSLALVELLTHQKEGNLKMGRLLQRCCKILNNNWMVKIHHTYREGNCCTDWLATHSISGELRLKIMKKTFP